MPVHRSSRPLAAAAWLLLPLAAAAQCPPDPTPTGVFGSPVTAFDPAEYGYTHGSTNLQGLPAQEKFATGLFWNPPGNFAGFSSLVVVNNPDPVRSATVSIDFFSESGQTLQSSTVVIAPNSSHVATAAALDPAQNPQANGRGSARITSLPVDGDFTPIVGATVHHAWQLYVQCAPFGTTAWGYIEDPELDPVGPVRPGETSYQQLQVRQDSTKLTFGPLPITNSSPSDFVNGASPVFWVMNPNPTVNTVTIAYTIGGTPLLPTRTVVLQPFGSFFDGDLWRTVNGIAQLNYGTWYDSGDLVVTIQGAQPILGEGMLIDVFANDPVRWNLSFLPWKKFRFASWALCNEPSGRLINAELTSMPSVAGQPDLVSTVMGVVNCGRDEAGPITVQYFNRNGLLVSRDRIPRLRPGATARIGKGFPQSPNFPTTAVFGGWVRISGDCNSDALCGWTIREVSFDYERAFGEELVGGNGNEPGLGALFFDPILSASIRRKVAPLARARSGAPGWFPGYATIVNTSAPNTGPYIFRGFSIVQGNPGLTTDLTNYTPCLQPFLGLRWANAAFTYFDKDPPPAGCPGGGDTVGSLPLAAATFSGRVDAVNPNPLAPFCEGVNTLGGPIRDYFTGFPHPANPNVEPLP